MYLEDWILPSEINENREQFYIEIWYLWQHVPPKRGGLPQQAGTCDSRANKIALLVYHSPPYLF
jgi:hypothetical protein